MKDENHPGSFSPVLDAAQALGTKVIRIWCGGGDSDKADDALFEQAARRTQDLADLAAEHGMILAFEFHRGGLTDTAPTAIRLLQIIDRPNVKTYYQVYDRGGAIAPQEELRQLLPYLQNVHCHHSVDGNRCLVEEGRELWTGLMDVLKENDHDAFVLIEFTLDNTPDNFLRDAAALRGMIGLE